MTHIAELRSACGAGGLLAVLAFTLATGCHRSAPSGDDSKGEPKAAPVVAVAKPVFGKIVRRIEQPGEIHAYEQAPLHARISGYVLKVRKDIGDAVKAGEALAELSVPEMDEELGQKKALAAQAEAEEELAGRLHDAARASTRSAAAKVKEAQSSRDRALAERRRADSQHERLSRSRSVVSAETVEEARLGAEAARAAVGEVDAKVKSAEAGLAESEAQEAKAKASVTVAAARLRVAQAGERRIAAMRGYATLRSPFAGVVTKRGIDPGHLVQPALAGTRGEPLFAVARLDPVRVFVDVPEEEAALIADGTPAVVRVQALKGEGFVGQVRRSAWALDPRSRTLRTEILLPNPGGRLRPGMYAYAAITVEREKAHSVPATAVVSHGEETCCFLARDGKAVRVSVRVGLRNAQSVQILEKRGPGQEGSWTALTGEEEVIAHPPAGLADGQPVVTKTP